MRTNESLFLLWLNNIYSSLNIDVWKINNHPGEVLQQHYPLHTESSSLFMGSRGVTKKSIIHPSIRYHGNAEWINRNYKWSLARCRHYVTIFVEITSNRLKHFQHESASAP